MLFKGNLECSVVFFMRYEMNTETGHIKSSRFGKKFVLKVGHAVKKRVKMRS